MATTTSGTSKKTETTEVKVATVYALVNPNGVFEPDTFDNENDALTEASMRHIPYGVVQMKIPAVYEPQD